MPVPIYKKKIGLNKKKYWIRASTGDAFLFARLWWNLYENYPILAGSGFYGVYSTLYLGNEINITESYTKFVTAPTHSKFMRDMRILGQKMLDFESTTDIPFEQAKSD